MKNSGQKLILRIALAIIAMIGAPGPGFSQTDPTPGVSEFRILIETTNDGFKLTSQGRTAWKSLIFTLNRDHPVAIDQYGMSSLKRDKPAKEGQLSNFLFTINQTKEGLSFEGIEGTAWKNLCFRGPKTKCHQYIDQNGMTELKQN